MEITMYYPDPQRTHQLFAEMNEATVRNRAKGIETIAVPCGEPLEALPFILLDEQPASSYQEQLLALSPVQHRREAA